MKRKLLVHKADILNMTAKVVSEPSIGGDYLIKKVEVDVGIPGLVPTLWVADYRWKKYKEDGLDLDVFVERIAELINRGAGK